MPEVWEWVAIFVVAIAFAIFVANAVYLGGVIKALNTENGNNIHLSKGGAKAFLWIDSILAAVLGLTLIFLCYVAFVKQKTIEVNEIASVNPVGPLLS